MKEYIIKVALDEGNFEEICKEPEEFFYPIEEFAEYKEKWHKVNGKHKITTLEEYFDLINTVYEISEGTVKICNRGMLIYEDCPYL